MRALLAFVGTLLFLAGPLYLKFGFRPISTPYEFAVSSPSARDYWIEHEGGGPSWIRHKYGRRWPLCIQRGTGPHPYAGEGARLWLTSVPGIDRDFLIVDICSGAYSFHRIVFLVEGRGSLLRVADIGTVGERRGDEDRDILAATFEDVDRDGIPELAEHHREWVYDEKGELVNNWGIRTVFYGWNGSTFTPKCAREDY